MRFDVNLSILFTELPAAGAAGRRQAGRLRRRRVLVALGRSPCPSDAELDAFVAADHATPACSSPASTSSPATCPAATAVWCPGPPRSSEFRDNIDVTVGLGERLGCRAFNALYGNRVDDSTPEEQDDLAVENLALAAGPARRIGGTVLVEPVSGAAALPAAHRRRRAEGDRPGRGDGGRMSRCCSTSTTSRSTATTSMRLSRRTLPGSVTCRSPTLPAATSPAPARSTSTATSAALAATGYDGWVGLEYKPSGASADAFDWLPRERRGRSSDLPDHYLTRKEHQT